MDPREKITRPGQKGLRAWLKSLATGIPLIGWLLGIFGAVLIEPFIRPTPSFGRDLLKARCDRLVTAFTQVIQRQVTQSTNDTQQDDKKPALDI